MTSKESVEQGIKFQNKEYVMLLKLKALRNPCVKVVQPLGNVENFIMKAYIEKYDPSTKSTFLTTNPNIFIVSPGASGSSLLYEAIGDLEKDNSAVSKSHSYDVMWKGHDCIKSLTTGGFMWEIEPDDKVIYLYAHPLNILMSLCKKINSSPEDWSGGNPHYVEFLECDIEEDFSDNYLHKDILNLERHLDKWWRQKNFNLLCMKYEKIHEYVDVLGEFLGNDLELPEPRKRMTDWTKSPDREKMLETYASLVEKYEHKPDYELFLKKAKN